MRPFVIKRKIQKVYRERWWVRAATLVLVLAGAVLLVYLVPRLAHKPSPVDVETSPSSFGPANARFKRDEFVIENPLINSAKGPLLSFGGRPGEVVKLYLTSAHLTAETVDNLKGDEGENSPPADDQPIEYLPLPGSNSPRQMPADNEVCTTSLSLEVAPGSKPPSRIHFFQPEGPGVDQQRVLAMMVDAELLVNLSTGPPPGNAHAPGCDKLLQVGKWTLANEDGKLSLKFIAPAGAKLTLIIEPFDMRFPSWKKDESIKSFEFAEPFPVQAVHINPLAPDGEPAVSSSATRSARSVDALPPLRVNSLAVGSEGLEMSVSGKGFVDSESGSATNLLEQATKNPVIQLLLSAVGLAFIGWWLRLVFRLFSRQS